MTGVGDALRSSPCLALDIGATKVEAALVRCDGKIGVRDRILVQEHADDLIGAIVAMARRVIANTNVELVGVGCAGPMTPGGEEVSPLNIPPWNDFPLRRLLRDALGVEVYVDGDARALALAEGEFGAARDDRSYLSMVVSTGVGGGIVMDGRLLSGDTGNAGHVGHLNVVPNGAMCSCGSYGCLEAEASGWAIEARTGRPASDADAVTRQRTGELVGRAVGTLASVLDFNQSLSGSATSSSRWRTRQRARWRCCAIRRTSRSDARGWASTARCSEPPWWVGGGRPRESLLGSRSRGLHRPSSFEYVHAGASRLAAAAPGVVAKIPIPAPSGFVVLALSDHDCERIVVVGAVAKGNGRSGEMVSAPAGRTLGFRDGARTALERHLRAAAVGERTSSRRLDAGRTGRVDRDVGQSERVPLGDRRSGDPGNRSPARDGQTAVEGSNATPDETLAPLARQLSMRLLPRTRRHDRSRRAAQPWRGARMDQCCGGVPSPQHAKG
jgi:glucokinase